MLNLPNFSPEAWTAIATAAGAAAVLLAAWLTKRRKKGKIEIVNICISEKSLEIAKVIYKFPVIDVMVKNVGDKVAVITRAEFEIRKVWNLTLQFPLMLALPVSGEYDVVIDPKENSPYTKQVMVSHVLKPDEADRFRFAFGLNPMSGFESVYYISFRLVFDGKRKTDAIDVLFVLPDRSATSPPYFLDDFYKQRDRYYEERDLDESAKEITMADTEDRLGPEDESYKARSRRLIKEARDSLFDVESAGEIDKYNRNILREVVDIGGTTSHRVSELIKTMSASLRHN